MGAFRLILIDDDLRRRAGICHCLSGNDVHVEPYENPSEVTGRWPEDGVLLAHDSGNTIELLMAHMSRSGAWLPIIAFAEAPDPRQVVRAVNRGIGDYLGWPFTAEEVEQAIVEGEQRAQTQASAMLREAMARSRVQKLTRRELEVLTAVAEGRSNRAIAEKLSISPRTVEIHRANMLSKLNASHTSEAIRIAIEASLVS